jgi:hypothetical protein
LLLSFLPFVPLSFLFSFSFSYLFYLSFRSLAKAELQQEAQNKERRHEFKKLQKKKHSRRSRIIGALFSSVIHFLFILFYLTTFFLTLFPYSTYTLFLLFFFCFLRIFRTRAQKQRIAPHWIRIQKNPRILRMRQNDWKKTKKSARKSSRKRKKRTRSTRKTTRRKANPRRSPRRASSCTSPNPIRRDSSSPGRWIPARKSPTRRRTLPSPKWTAMTNRMRERRRAFYLAPKKGRSCTKRSGLITQSRMCWTKNFRQRYLI